MIQLQYSFTIPLIHPTTFPVQVQSVIINLENAVGVLKRPGLALRLVARPYWVSIRLPRFHAKITLLISATRDNRDLFILT